MDISADKYKSDGNRAGPFLAVLQTVRGIAGWLIGFFTLTEADRLKAGIYVGGKGVTDNRPGSSLSS
jgi:hypothetical protein